MTYTAGWALAALGLAPIVAQPGLVMAAPAPGPSSQGDVSVTIYANNQALVQDVRSITFGGGRQKIEFRNVSAQIRPETAALVASDMQVIEQNFDYDL